MTQAKRGIAFLMALVMGMSLSAPVFAAGETVEETILPIPEETAEVQEETQSVTTEPETDSEGAQEQETAEPTLPEAEENPIEESESEEMSEDTVSDVLFSDIWTEDYLEQVRQQREAMLAEGDEDAIDWEESEDWDEASLMTADYPMLMSDLSGYGTITSIDKRNYKGTLASTFGITVNGATYTGYCMQHQKGTPDKGSSVTVSQIYDTSIAKLLYYGWNGPGQWSGFSSENQGRVVTALAMSWAYSGIGTVSWTAAYRTGVVTEFYNWALAQPDPTNTTIGFSTSSLVSSKDVNSTVQTTSTVTVFCGNSGNSISFQMPSGPVTLVNESTGAKYSSGSWVTLKADQKLHLEAPLNYSGTWSVTASGNLQKATAYKAVQSSDQDAGILIMEPAPEQASLSATFSAMERKYASIPVGGTLQIKLTVHKTDADGKPLSGAVFEITDGQNSYTTSPTDRNGNATATLSYPTTTVDGWYVTNPESLTPEEIGQLHSVFVYTNAADALKQAQSDWEYYRKKGTKTVTIHELVVPDGYERAADVQATVNFKNAVLNTSASSDTQRVAVVTLNSTVKNYEAPHVESLGAEFSQYVTLHKEDGETGANLAGATFRVTNTDQPTNSNPYFANEEFSAKTMVTGSNGNAVSSAFQYTLAYRWFYCTNWDKLSSTQRAKVTSQYKNMTCGAFYQTYAAAKTAYDQEKAAKIAAEKHSYRVEEISAPDGFYLDSTARTVTIAGANSASTSVLSVTTDENGHAAWSDLAADRTTRYLIVETATAQGNTLLSDPVEVGTIPMELDTAPTEHYDGLYYEADGGFYYYDLTYEITNHAVFQMPATGGLGLLPLACVGGLLLAISAGAAIIQKKRYNEWRTIL